MNEIQRFMSLGKSLRFRFSAVNGKIQFSLYRGLNKIDGFCPMCEMSSVINYHCYYVLFLQKTFWKLIPCHTFVLIYVKINFT